MSRQKNYLIDLEGNETLLEKFIAAIHDHTCKTASEYPNPYLLDTGEKFLNSSVINYFLQSRPFSKELFEEFFEKVRKLEPRGFNSYSYTLGLWIKSQLKVFRKKESLSVEEQSVLSFICYVAVCHIKYGASYETITANEYFDQLTELGSKEVVRLKKEGTGRLPKELLEYKDAEVSCKANDVFATIKIKLIEETGQAYKKVLTFVNKLLQSDFPKSYEISFSTKVKSLLPIKGLPKCGQHHLFAGAVKYANLHNDILKYINLSKNEFEWYNNLEEENCAMPSTFAVFALGLESETYFDTVIDYLQTVDDGHQSIQEKFTLAFIEKFGVNAQSIKVYIHCILSTQSHAHKKAFITHFTTEAGLNLLLDSKINFIAYYFTTEELKETEDKEDLAAYCWENVIYTTFGNSLNKIPKQLNESEKAIFGQLLVK